MARRSAAEESLQQATDRALEVIGPERCGYRQALETQQRLRRRCAASGGRENFLMLLEHPPVITIGRSGLAGEVLADRKTLRERGVEVLETNRGGRVTFHGPGQLVAYPIVDLTARGRDLHRYLRELEGWLLRLLESYGIGAGLNPPYTGVWVGGRKIASIGIAVRHWVAYHGAALNVTTDLEFFRLIVPCGLPGVRVTSMQEVLGRPPDLAEVARRAARLFCEDFGFADVPQSRQSERVRAG